MEADTSKRGVPVPYAGQFRTIQCQEEMSFTRGPRVTGVSFSGLGCLLCFGMCWTGTGETGGEGGGSKEEVVGVPTGDRGAKTGTTRETSLRGKGL